MGDRNAVVLVLRRNEKGDSLESAEILQQWLDDTLPTLPPTIKIQLFNERWELIKDRILLLLKNGAGGLVLVLLILYLFLSTRVACGARVQRHGVGDRVRSESSRSMRR